MSILLILPLLTACSSQSKTEKQYADNDYIKAMQTGLEERQKIVSTDKYDSGSTSERDLILSDGIKKEQEILKPFKEKEFQSPELKKIRDDYNNALQEQLDSLPSGGDFNKIEAFDKAYDKRSQLINILIDKFGLKLNSELEKEFKLNANSVNKKEDTNKKLLETLKNAKFEEIDTFHYGAKITNNTGNTIKDTTLICMKS
ncbi:hypothetical protein [Peptostreptococcus equinus]|uniref:Lipoprotein n=1 Tax=Peptostreptococcus equinus TaxID=3003601 RepID=A0ABY7JQW7_9FIRM|nr:hypothetical protein [Peptostreptococcus sp. CBA3647]WAW15748.1 hypothetical protein O0R46_04665 [Peptostreptococcus sp. CBA3647]